MPTRSKLAWSPKKEQYDFYRPPGRTLFHRRTSVLNTQTGRINLNNAVATLIAERDRIVAEFDSAIAAIGRPDEVSSPAQRGRPPKASEATPKRAGRTAAQKKAQSLKMAEIWAKRKRAAKKAAAPAATADAPKRRGRPAGSKNKVKTNAPTVNIPDVTYEPQGDDGFDQSANA
jgi:hypothetical protein